jgi:hypothetical protein
MDVPVLHRLEPSPYRVGADRGMKAPIDREDHIGLPGEELLGGDLDDRPRRGILGDDIARPEEVDDLAGDRAGDRRLEAGWSARDIDARPLGGWDLRDRLQGEFASAFGIASLFLCPHII